jgi:hypothetical protein
MFDKKHYPSLIILFYSLFLIVFIASNYHQTYQDSIKQNLAMAKVSDKLIKSNYTEVQKVVQVEGEEQVLTVLEKKIIKTKPAEREVKGIYLTGYGVSSPKIYGRALKLLDDTELNAVIIDIKDYSGQLSYKSSVPLAVEMGADKIPKIKEMKKIIDELHAKDVYVIARQTIFQDPIISKNKPEWAVMNKNTGRVWVDRKGIGWADPSVKEVWDYNIEIAKEAVALGFDEINLDYIRFPTDGSMSAMQFHNYTKEQPKHETIRAFIKYFSEQMQDEPAYISVDFFGLVTVKVKENDDLGIGQLLIDAVPYVDYISPMVYPSHYAVNFNGYKNPASYPYEIVKYSMDKAKMAFEPEFLGEEKVRAKMRPWLQDFDMGAVYNSAMVKKQITASKDAGTFGWLLWDPRNMYTEGALEKSL